MASIHGKLKDLDGWIRNRLRYCIWHHWKKPERKRKNLLRLGVDQEHAYAWSRTRKGGWAVAQSPILGTTITLDRLKKRGYVSMLELYQRIAPHLNEPLYTRPAWFMLSLSKCTVVLRQAQQNCERFSPSATCWYCIINMDV
jgi:RNA-directed DNA polymerase